MSKTVLTYGTFDLLHVGHLRLLQRLRALGDRLIVGVSTDEFNLSKSKRCIIPYEQRADLIANLKQVDLVIPESSWEQKRADVLKYNVDIFAMGNDWKGKFDDLGDLCKVVYLERTEGVSTTEIKSALSGFDETRISELKKALEIVLTMAEGLK